VSNLTKSLKPRNRARSFTFSWIPAGSTGAKAMLPSFSTEIDTVTITWVEEKVVEAVQLVQVVSTLAEPPYSIKVTQ
jgi:hypothetical protein